MNKDQIEKLNDIKDKSKELGKFLGWEALRHGKKRQHLDDGVLGQANLCDSINASACNSVNARVCWCICV